jgi:glycosyltransferase involved in cell wall biosynthesis
MEAGYKIAICILTYKRAEGLKRLLTALKSLEFSAPAPPIKVVVIDNDPGASAQDVIERFQPDYPCSLIYDVESQRSIAAARNKALKVAGDDVDWIAFIDDDEIPPANWLDELLRVQQEYQADVVAGPALPVYESSPPDWIEKGKFFHRRRYRTGHVLPFARSSNILFRAAIPAAIGSGFDNRFALTGGEDRHFFQRVGMQGYKIVWADEAIVEDAVPADRMNAAYLLRRTYAQGCQNSVIEIDLSRSTTIHLNLFIKGVYWISWGIARAVFGLFQGRHAIVKGVQLAAYGAGRIMGTMGWMDKPYGKG